MFDPTSRYFAIEDATLTKEEDGRVILYKKRRFIPAAEKMMTTTILNEMTVIAGDRLDNISGRIFGDPLQFWRICDANNIIHPLELAQEPGKVIRIPFPGR
jgi:nucleoid-associated protein YgaU